jgi:hypothetical protein
METIKEVLKAIRVNKWINLKVIQQHYGNGWEDNSEYNTSEIGYRELLKHDYKEYVLTGYPTRVVNRSVINPLYGK